MTIQTRLRVNHEKLRKKLEEHYQYGEDWTTRYLHQQRVIYLAETIREYSKDAKTAIDIGCGDGVYTTLLAAENVFTIGMDISEYALRQTRTLIKSEGFYCRVQLVNCSAEFLPFRRQSFDLILCSEVIEHLNGPRKGIAEISRLLKVTGSVVLTVPNVLSYYWLRRKIGYKTLRLARLRGKSIETEQHTSFSYIRIIELLKESGLGLQSISSTNIFPVPFLLIKKLALHKTIVNMLENLDNQLRQTPFKVLGSSAVVTARRYDK